MSDGQKQAATLEAGLDMIAICDHNAAGNTAAVQEAAAEAAAAELRLAFGLPLSAPRDGMSTVHDLSLYLLELLENSIRAQATHIAIAFTADRASNRVRLVVDDDGTGLALNPDAVLDPFYTTKAGRKTGLGLSLLKADAEATGGHLTLGASPVMQGARVEVAMVLDHIDRTPIGDLGETVMVMEATNPDIVFTISLYGDRFDPPIVDGSLREVRQCMASVIDELDGHNTTETATSHNHQCATTRSVPADATSKGRD